MEEVKLKAVEEEVVEEINWVLFLLILYLSFIKGFGFPKPFIIYGMKVDKLISI